MIIKNSIKQSEILEILAKTRGANAEQITRALYDENGLNKLTQSYELLNKLIIKKYVQYFTYKDENSHKRLYFLSKKGLNLYQSYYRVTVGKTGSGLFNDFGYFTHALYKPKNKQMKHLLMTIDAMIDVYLLKKKLNIPIDFANNLYCATNSVKPDFLIQIENHKYFVEIDRMNERGIALNKKFEKYNLYFEQIDCSLVKGIYFVVPTPKNGKANEFDSRHNLRCKSVFNAYLETCEYYQDKIDLCFVTKNEFPRVLNEDFQIEKQHNPLVLNFLYKKSKQGITYSTEYIYFLSGKNNVISITKEINYRRTKIWFDLLQLQKEYSILHEAENIFQVNYKHVPDINVLTTKENLECIITENKFLEVLTPTKIVRKNPKIEIME